MISNFASARILNNICGNYTKGSSTDSYQAIFGPIYLGLSSTDPAVSVTEPSGNGYVRTKLKMPLISSGTSVTNTEELHFNEATGAWGALSYACLYDAQTGGNLIAWGTLTNQISPVADTVPIIRSGELTVSIT